MEPLNRGLANNTHQLLVSVSKHLFVAKHGILKYQEKPMDVHINNYANSKKEHLVYYVMQDRWSGNFVFDVATTVAQVPLLDFLHYAWKRDKDEDHFWGLPLSLSVPKRISSPEMLEGLRMLGVETFHPSSGFDSGVRILRSLEESLCFYLLGRSAIHSLDNVGICKSRIYHYMLERNKEDNKVAMWQGNLPPGHPQDVPDYSSFVRSFPVPAEAKQGLKLFQGADTGAAGNGRQLDFLTVPVDGKKYSEGKLFKAEEIVFEAWRFFDWEKRLKLAYEALRIAPYCADAYNLLAAKSDYPDEKIMLYQRGVKAGEVPLGETFFRENTGHFWGMVESRPYMRSLAGLADSYREKGELEKAISLYHKLLSLNPNDNQGVRYLLAYSLLERGRDADFAEFIKEHGDEASCFMAYSKALWAFRSGAEWKEAYLREALEENCYVPPYLLGEKILPYQLPDYYSPGSEEEAVLYAKEALTAWKNTAGALDWLKEMLPAG